MTSRILIIIIAIFLAASAVTAAVIEIAGNRLYSDKQLSRLVDFSLPPDSIATKIAELYHDAGYFGIELKWENEKSANKLMIISEGAPTVIGIITIDIAPDSLSIFDDLKSRAMGQVASRRFLDEFAEAVVSRLTERGMPFAKAEWTGFSIGDHGSLVAEMRVLPGPVCVIGGFAYNGISRTRRQTVRRVARLNIGDIYSEDEVIGSEKRIDRMPFIEVISPFDIELTGREDSCEIIYHLKELPSSRFDGAGGIVAYKGKSEFVGFVDLQFGDILGTGRSFGLRWNKKDRLSGELRLNYYEPFLFSTPFDSRLEVYQVDRDSLYIESGGSIGIGYHLRDNIKTELKLGIRRVEPETGAALSSSTSRSVGFSIAYDATDYPANPRGGYRLGTAVDYRYRSNRNVIAGDRPPTNLSSVGFDQMWYISLLSNLVAATGVKGWGIVNADGTVPVDELRFVGGFENLRGYAEQRFPAFRYGIATAEARLITGRSSRVYLFTDLGAVKSSQSRENKYEFLPGYGMGVVSPTSLGLFKVEIGWGKTGFPEEPVVNFGVTGSF